MFSDAAVSRRELLKRLGMAGAAALALPEFDRVLAFQRDVLKAGASQGGRADRGRSCDPGRRVRAHHPDR